MRWHLFHRQEPDTVAEQIAETRRRQEVYRLAREAETYADRLQATVTQLRQELEHGR